MPTRATTQYGVQAKHHFGMTELINGREWRDKRKQKVLDEYRRNFFVFLCLRFTEKLNVSTSVFPFHFCCLNLQIKCMKFWTCWKLKTNMRQAKLKTVTTIIFRQISSCSRFAQEIHITKPTRLMIPITIAAKRTSVLLLPLFDWIFFAEITTWRIWK